MPIAAEIYFRFFGEKTPSSSLEVILLHGAGGNHLYWPSPIRRLHGYRVYALDLPGHSRSIGTGYQRIEDYAEAVRKWMEEIEVQRAVVVGHSMGGAIAQMMALHYPQQVVALGLIATAPRLPVNAELLESSGNPSLYKQAVRKLLEWSFSPNASQELIALASRRLMEVRPALLNADLIACNHFDISVELSKITQPTLVVCGDQDRMTPLRSARTLVDGIPKAKLHIIPQAGHMVMLEKPQEVAQILSEFLHDLSSSPNPEDRAT